MGQPVVMLPVLAALVVTAKLGTVDTPYYWDEVGWAGSARWLAENNLLRVLPGLHPPATFWGHPPALYLAQAAIWKVTGDSIRAAHLLILAFAVVGVWFTYLLGRRLHGPGAGLLAAALLFLSPMYFAQSAMFLADLPVAALAVASVYCVLAGHQRAYLVCATTMVLVKETGAAVVAAVAVYQALGEPRGASRKLARLARYGLPLAALGAFWVWQKATTGSFFWIYESDIAFAESSPSVILRKLQLVPEWALVRQGRLLMVITIALGLILGSGFRRRPELRLFLLVGLFGGLPFAAIYFLPRYLLPLLPFVYLAGAWALMSLPVGRAVKAVAIALLVGASLWGLPRQPFQGNAEFNLGYLDVVAVHRDAIGYVGQAYAGRRVLTVWPHDVQLTTPFAGYVDRPWRVARADRVPPEPGDVLLLSTPGTHPDTAARAATASSGWALVRRFERAGAVVEVYVRT